MFNWFVNFSDFWVSFMILYFSHAICTISVLNICLLCLRSSAKTIQVFSLNLFRKQSFVVIIVTCGSVMHSATPQILSSPFCHLDIVILLCKWFWHGDCIIMTTIRGNCTTFLCKNVWQRGFVLHIVGEGSGWRTQNRTCLSLEDCQCSH